MKCGTTLLVACKKNELAIVRELVKAGADVNVRGGVYGFPLEAVALVGSEEIV